jgi:hypothetical protein
MRNRKHKHKHKEETLSLSERKEVRDLAPYNRAVYELIKSFREQSKALVCTAPF